MYTNVSGTWQCLLQPEIEKPYFQSLASFVDDERSQYTVFPEDANVFSALQHTAYEQVRVVILGQDPYHNVGQAHGLCFSVLPGVKPPPSLVNIYKELKSDLDIPLAEHGYLDSWARQGVLMLNTALTVRAHEPLSHRNRGWETFTTAILQAVDIKETPVIFLLWGSPAQKIASNLHPRHTMLKAAHPSPLSAYRGFFGCKHFSQVNALLAEREEPPIDWCLPVNPILE